MAGGAKEIADETIIAVIVMACIAGMAGVFGPEVTSSGEHETSVVVRSEVDAQVWARLPGACVVEAARGDEVLCRDGVTVRLNLIDAPEQPFGAIHDSAVARVARLALPGTRLSVVLDEKALDPHNRVLAYLYFEDGVMLNELLVRRGIAVHRVYPPNATHDEAIRKAHGAARASRIGLWKDPGFVCFADVGDWESCT
jgi:endonuclease YncB( thermonuclease family)